MTEKVDYETVEAEPQRQIHGLYGADATTVRAENDRLRRLAEQIDHDTWRRRAIQQPNSYWLWPPGRSRGPARSIARLNNCSAKA